MKNQFKKVIALVALAILTGCSKEEKQLLGDWRYYGVSAEGTTIILGDDIDGITKRYNDNGTIDLLAIDYPEYSCYDCYGYTVVGSDIHYTQKKEIDMSELPKNSTWYIDKGVRDTLRITAKDQDFYTIWIRR